MKESDLRNWVKSVWGKNHVLTWVEPRRGSSVGACDVYLPFDRLLLPVELKVFSETTSGFVCAKAVRPAQLVYHHSLVKSGIMSGFMFVTGKRNSPVYFARSYPVVYACMHNQQLPKSKTIVLSKDADLNTRYIDSEVKTQIGPDQLFGSDPHIC